MAIRLPALKKSWKRPTRTSIVLAGLGIDIDKVTQQLEDEGIEKFNKPFDSLMSNLEKKRGSFCLAEAS